MDPPTHRIWRLDLPVAAAIAVATLALFWPVRHFGWINFDDPQYVLRNPHVTGGLTAADARWAFSPGTFAYWHPLTWLSLQLDVTLWGPRPGPMHVESAALHAAAAAGWYLLWAGLTGRRSRAAAVAALFAAHPTRVESVAWIAERKDVLCGLFTVAVLLAYASRRTGLAVGCYALAVMAKPVAVVVPAYLLLLDAWPMRRRLTWRRLWPFAGLAGAGVALTLLAGGQSPATPTLAQLGVRDRLATATLGYVRHLGHLAVPVRLSIFYPYRFGEPTVAVASAGGLLAVITWAAWRARRRRPYLIVGWLWFAVGLLPSIGLVQSGEQSMADRFAYTAAVGVFVAIVWLACDIGGRVAGVALAAAVGAAAVGTAWDLPAWRDGASIWAYSAASVDQRDPVIDAHLAGAVDPSFSGGPEGRAANATRHATPGPSGRR